MNATINGRQVAYQADDQREGRRPAADRPRVQRAGAGGRAIPHRDQRHGLRASGEGTDPKTMTVAARGELTESTILGGHIPQLTFDAQSRWRHAERESGRQLRRIRSRGDQRPRRGSRAPSRDSWTRRRPSANVSAGVSLDSVEASGRITLEPSTVGALQITRAVVDADYRDRAAEIRDARSRGPRRQRHRHAARWR